ncbi:MAG: pilus assembly protein PilM [bacterium]|nr:pilus assembly protein PilM [bacterium]
MWPSITSNSAPPRGNLIARAFARWFPTPQLLVPRSAGIDISDASIKWIVIVPHQESKRVLSFGSQPLAPGIVVEGTIRDESALALALKQVKTSLGTISCAHAALPEEAAFVFNMHVPEKSEHEQILRMIEFELDGRVPISPTDAVYDFNIITAHDDGVGTEIGVVVFPRDLAASYVRVFDAAGIELLSLEVEARSIARAISSNRAVGPITLSVDFGLERTGFAVLKHGVPIFTSTVAVGGNPISRSLMETLSISDMQAQEFKNEEGLLPKDGVKSAGTEIIAKTASVIADEVTKHYRYWDTRRNDKGERVTPVETVLLVGGNANIKGLADYIAERVQAPTERPDVWQNVCSFEEYIPPIDRRTSLQFATAIGLALRGV